MLDRRRAGHDEDESADDGPRRHANVANRDDCSEGGRDGEHERDLGVVRAG
jgi:hypothetical protein